MFFNQRLHILVALLSHGLSYVTILRTVMLEHLIELLRVVFDQIFVLFLVMCFSFLIDLSQIGNIIHVVLLLLPQVLLQLHNVRLSGTQLLKTLTEHVKMLAERLK